MLQPAPLCVEDNQTIISSKASIRTTVNTVNKENSFSMIHVLIRSNAYHK